MGVIFKYKVHCKGYDYDTFFDAFVQIPLSELPVTSRMKMLCRTIGFTLYGNWGVDFFSTSELLQPNMRNRLRLIKVRLHFYMVSNIPNDSLGNVDCLLHTRRIALKSEYREEKKTVHACKYSRWIQLLRFFGEDFTSFLPHKTSSLKK